MDFLNEDEMNKINGGGLFGAGGGAVIGYVVGSVAAVGISLVDPKATNETFAKTIYTFTVGGAAVGGLLTGPM